MGDEQFSFLMKTEIKVKNQGLKHPVVASWRLSNPDLETGFEIAKNRRIAKILGEPVEQTDTIKS